MQPKMIWKLAIDLVMTLLLLCQMAYLLIGETAHEWIGAAMFLLFLLHHLLNWRWYKNLVRGRYTPLRWVQTVVNFLVLAAMVALMVSGILLSREVFAFLPIHGGTGFARTLHMLGAYWGFLLMSVHLGLHWGMVRALLGRAGGRRKPSPVRTWVLRGLLAIFCAVGVYAFFKHNIADYLFLRSRFVFFDMEQPLALFLGEYLAMMVLWACLAYCGTRLLQRCGSRRAPEQTPVSQQPAPEQGAGTDEL